MSSLIWPEYNCKISNKYVNYLQTQFASEDVGPHLLGVEEFLQAHALQELQVNSLGETQRRYIRQGQSIKHSNSKDIKLLGKSLSELDKSYTEYDRYYFFEFILRFY